MFEQSAGIISGISPNTATLSPQHAMHPFTPSMDPILSTDPWSDPSSFTRFPSAVAQQSARMTSSENTVLMLLFPRETEGPTVLDEEQIPVMWSDYMRNAISVRTG